MYNYIRYVNKSVYVETSKYTHLLYYIQVMFIIYIQLIRALQSDTVYLRLSSFNCDYNSEHIVISLSIKQTYSNCTCRRNKYAYPNIAHRKTFQSQKCPSRHN